MSKLLLLLLGLLALSFAHAEEGYEGAKPGSEMDDDSMEGEDGEEGSESEGDSPVDHEHDQGELDSEGEGDDEDMTPEKLKSIVETHIDKDKDGHVTQTELVTFSAWLRDRMKANVTKETLVAGDSNHDGKLSKAEIVAMFSYEPPAPEEGEVEADPDMDRMVKLEELLNAAKFDLADADKDGFLSEQETFYFLHPQEHPELLKLDTKHYFDMKDIDDSGDLTWAEFMGWTAANPPENVADLEKPDAEFVGLDTDKNGKLSLAEFEAWVVLGNKSHEAADEERMGALVKAADVNSDGKISLAEWKESHDAVIHHEAFPELFLDEEL